MSESEEKSSVASYAERLQEQGAGRTGRGTMVALTVSAVVAVVAVRAWLAAKA